MIMVCVLFVLPCNTLDRSCPINYLSRSYRRLKNGCYELANCCNCVCVGLLIPLCLFYLRHRSSSDDLASEKKRSAGLTKDLTAEKQRAEGLTKDLTAEKQRAEGLTKDLTAEKQRAEGLTKDLN